MNAILHLSFVGHIVFPSPGAGTGNQEGPFLHGRSILSFLCRDLLLPGTDALSPAWLFRHQFRSWQPGGGQHPLPKVPPATWSDQSHRRSLRSRSSNSGHPPSCWAFCPDEKDSRPFRFFRPSGRTFPQPVLQSLKP